MKLSLPLEYSATTHPGLKRENNEDCFLSLPEAGLWAVADGMGGHEAGEVASAIVRDTLAAYAQQTGKFLLGDAIQRAHKAILEAANKGIGAPGMGSTVVALFSRDKSYEVAWVGDSRAYLWSPNENGGLLTRLTNDHSYVQMLYDSGAIPANELETHPDKNIITQCLGMTDLVHVNVDILQGQWQQDQWILMCSDGLTDELSDSAIARILANSPNSPTAIDQLMQEALDKGGSDNLTMQIVESPLKTTHKKMNAWNWIPAISSNRKIDILFFAGALVALLGLLFATLK